MGSCNRQSLRNLLSKAQIILSCQEKTKNNVFYIKNTSALTILKQKGAKNVVKFAKDIEMILKLDRSYPKRQWEFHASVQ